MNELKEVILPGLSLLIAALAIFVGPFVSAAASKRQAEQNLRIAKKSIVSPIRQAWINELREIIAGLTGKCAYYWCVDIEKRDERELQNISLLIAKLKLYINPNEDDHKLLLHYVTQMQSELEVNDDGGEYSKFWHSHTIVVEQSQKILKQEWEVVKNEI